MSGDRQWIRAALRAPPAAGGAVQLHVLAARPRAPGGALRRADLEEALGLPIRMSGPESIKPLYALPGQFGPTVSRRVRRHLDHQRHRPRLAHRPLPGASPTCPATASPTRRPPTASSTWPSGPRPTPATTPSSGSATSGSGPRSCAAWRPSCWTWLCIRRSSSSCCAAWRTTSCQTMEILFARFAVRRHRPQRRLRHAARHAHVARRTGGGSSGRCWRRSTPWPSGTAARSSTTVAATSCRSSAT